MALYSFVIFAIFCLILIAPLSAEIACAGNFEQKITKIKKITKKDGE